MLRPTERGAGRVNRAGAPVPMTNKQVESCFLNHNSSIHFCCTDSLLMTHRGGLSVSIIIWRIGGPVNTNKLIIHKFTKKRLQKWINV